MSATAALSAISTRIRTQCAAHVGNRVYDLFPGDSARDGVSPEEVNPGLRVWFGELSVEPDAGCGAHRATMRLYVEGQEASRLPVWDAALAIMAALDGNTNDAFGECTITGPAGDVDNEGHAFTAVAIDIGFTIPA